ncbi:MAG: DegT/DnrJ/EryC1/StrS family aminotransferase [Oligoflexia bacterium]|nr:DegT/DnrJ/EryC1/StrS family aminotransferase [Oligoflexia bacterium]
MDKTIPMMDLSRQNEPLKEEFFFAFSKVLQHQKFIMGPEVLAFEDEIARYCQTPFALGVSSGTDALLMALMALGIGEGDEVLTTSFSFVATAGVIARVGATPLFVDIDPETFNISPAQIEKKISSKCKAIIVVHLFGQSAEMDSILDIARGHQLRVIEDAAQSIGAEYKGIRVGAIGDIGCFSFFPGKNLGALGDAGVVVTKERELYEKMKSIRVHGAKKKYYHDILGGNFRLDTLQASFLQVKLRHLDEYTLRRQENAKLYRQGLSQLQVDSKIQLPIVYEKASRHVYNQFTIKCLGGVKERDQFKDYLNAIGIGCEVYYPCPLHKQQCFEKFYGDDDQLCPCSELASEQVLSLPIYEGLKKEEQNYIIEKIKRFFYD